MEQFKSSIQLSEQAATLVQGVATKIAKLQNWVAVKPKERSS